MFDAEKIQSKAEKIEVAGEADTRPIPVSESVNVGSDGYRRSYLQLSQHKEAHNLGSFGRFPY